MLSAGYHFYPFLCLSHSSNMDKHNRTSTLPESKNKNSMCNRFSTARSNPCGVCHLLSSSAIHDRSAEAAPPSPFDFRPFLAFFPPLLPSSTSSEWGRCWDSCRLQLRCNVYTNWYLRYAKRNCSWKFSCILCSTHRFYTKNRPVLLIVRVIVTVSKSIRKMQLLKLRLFADCLASFQEKLGLASGRLV